MTFFVTPTQADLPWYRFSTTLSGVVYTLRLRYNTRMQRWILDIADPANNDILTGLPILINRNVRGQYVITGLPPGTFFATDDSGQQSQPTQFSFSIDHTLFYADPTQ